MSRLDDEEALAVAVALREAALSGVLGGDQAALSALLKLQRLLPPRLADRLAGLNAAVEHTPRIGESVVSSAVLLELASACRRGERLRMSYRDMNARETIREIDPYRLVRTSHRWYVVAMDVAKGQWRTFRADRVIDARTTGHAVHLVDPPDAARLVAEMLVSDYPLYTTIRLPVPVDQAKRIVPPGRGVHEPAADCSTLVTIGGVDADDLATYLISRATTLQVISPDEVREALHRRLREILGQ
ncbi:WYL domain-containing protein [Kibdelosporangium philippinense]|uniref:WYL domain-containing protein n=1 Tax=Kibdelosporangium philippinense TaxID=211113 RepID=A0ABS8ZRA7_9PSEU|nr:WYL domain-containing protein [Kibdelosporangium philippinense]MCE7010250.1 WYL domain-containing protein [Kibdelosporangium philippinense]